MSGLILVPQARVDCHVPAADDRSAAGGADVCVSVNRKGPAIRETRQLHARIRVSRIGLHGTRRCHRSDDEPAII